MENLKALGKSPRQPGTPEEAELERVPNPHPDCNLWPALHSRSSPRFAQ